MSRWSDTIAAMLLLHEGHAYVDDPDDAGGPSRFGVSLREMRRLGGLIGDIDNDGDVDADHVRALTELQALDFYRTHFWDTGGYCRIESQWVAEKIFDLAVNVGPRQAHKMLQRACRAGNGLVRYPIDDGILGPVTIAAVNALDADMLVPALRSEAAGFYRLLVALNPRHAKYLTGWLARAYE